MQDERREAEALRRRLYRPDSSPADLEAYQHVAAPEAPEDGPEDAAVDAQEPASSAPPARPRRRPALLRTAVAGVGVVLVASAVAVGAVALRAAPHADPTPSAVRWTAAPRDPGDVMNAPSVLDGGVRDHARGQAAAASGDGIVYTTAHGDTVPAIAGRFGLCSADVLTALPYGFDPARLPTGQHLLLQRLTTTAQRDEGSGAC